ncbi:DUF1491 family protein [Kordiimonas lipolytica]|uniref:DUF1491 family protein n=1 Tax=Kordiimonas lipolytica TaxID=1662421 RepID=A0ABV8U669_9PROT|nr:DUF1491 family protein [Kordiimonas lipolytica]
MTARLSTKFWIDAHLRTCFGADMPSFVVAKGDAERGGVILKVNRFKDGVLLFEQSLDFDGNRIWRRLGAAEGQDEQAADALIAKKRGFDPDLWVIEIEDSTSKYVPDAPISEF